MADMSHTLRTPLNGVLGLTQALGATNLDEHQRALLTDIMGSAGLLDRLVNGLLDFEEVDRHGSQPLAAPTPKTDGEQGGVRVLVADDNPTNRKVIELILRASDAQVVSVENGAEAVSAWRSGRFDVILMDLRMPVMGGIEAIRQIRAEEDARELPRSPILVVSANTSPQDRHDSAGAGADGHLAKPIRAEELIGAILGLLAA